MKRFIAAAAVICTLALAGTAAAALQPGVYDPDHSGCVTSTYTNGVLHLAKTCDANAAAGADITGLDGQTFQSASFTLASAGQCTGGSPRFDVVTTAGLFFLGCTNVTPTTNSDGTATYSFTAANGFGTSGQPATITGTITGVSLLIDVVGSADVSNIQVNGTSEVPLVGPPASKDQCKKGGWKKFNNPSFRNQGQCVSYVEHHSSHGRSHHELRDHENDGD